MCLFAVKLFAILLLFTLFTPARIFEFYTNEKTEIFCWFVDNQFIFKILENEDEMETGSDETAIVFLID